MDSDTYTVTVTFERSLAEDLETAKLTSPNKTVEEALQIQLARELQSACDEGCLVGFFQVNAVKLHPEVNLE